MGSGSPAEVTADRKRRFSRLLREWVPLRLAMRVAAWLKAPRQPVGALGVVFDAGGRVLIVEHVFRTDFPWGLPGGWIEHGEDPRDAVRRELEEELGLRVEIGALLDGAAIGLVARSTHPRHIGLVYSCRLLDGTPRPSGEVVSIEWVEPGHLGHELAPFQAEAIRLAALHRAVPQAAK